MKKLFLTCLFVLFAVQVWAAGTITVVYDVQPDENTRVVAYSVAFDSAAASPAATALNSISVLGGLIHNGMGGWWILEVSTLYGTTGPTDDTDLYLYRNYGTNKIDVLGGNGVNSIDNAANVTFNPATTTRPLMGDEIISISNNAVNSATCTIVFTLYK